jgi:(p)ppGpp synthase/HD superfamily hydrolase
LGPRFSTALAFAHEVHGDQLRKGSSVPYIAHLLAVTALVIEAGGNEDTAIAALLHDAVEDHGGKKMLKRIRKRFGPKVAAVVDECSDASGTPKPKWKPRKKAYLATIPRKSPAARLVSLADKVHNADSILADYRRVGEKVWRRFTGGREGTLWYYRALADAFRRRSHPRLARRLEETVHTLEVEAGVR